LLSRFASPVPAAIDRVAAAIDRLAVTQRSSCQTDRLKHRTLPTRSSRIEHDKVNCDEEPAVAGAEVPIQR
jgi:hypothetical protein